MKRHDTQGKVVKTTTYTVTQPDVTEKQEKIAIRFSTDGYFRVDLPKHIADYFGPRAPWEHEDDRLNFYQGEISAMTLKAVEDAFTNALRRYRDELKNTNRRKMIVVSFRANFRGPVMLGGFQVSNNSLSGIADISFAGSPALELSYEILWQINDRLYRVYGEGRDGEPPQMTYMKSMPRKDATPRFNSKQETFVIEWTEEREEFFRAGVEGMNVLIAKIAQMLLGDTASNVDALIAGGGMLALPAPTAQLESE